MQAAVPNRQHPPRVICLRNIQATIRRGRARANDHRLHTRVTDPAVTATSAARTGRLHASHAARASERPSGRSAAGGQGSSTKPAIPTRRRDRGRSSNWRSAVRPRGSESPGRIATPRWGESASNRGAVSGQWNRPWAKAGPCSGNSRTARSITGHQVVWRTHPSRTAVASANPPRNPRARPAPASAKRDTPPPVNGCQAPSHDRLGAVGAAQAWVGLASDTGTLHREAGSAAIHPVGEFRFAEPVGPGASSLAS